MKRALVLSGGGSKGSYQMGVWKALKKLHIKIDIVTGTSIGALNGALIVQNSYFKGLYMWKNLNMKALFGDEAIESDNNFKIFDMYKKNFLKNGGMEVKKIEEIIDEAVDQEKFFASDIDYGLITFNFTKKKPCALKKKDIKEENLVDYLMASSTCFPAFQMKNINGKKYIDGGYFDNLPINLAIEMGADEIIAVDLTAPGFKQIPKKKLPTTKIKPNNKLSFFLNFNETGTSRNIKLGFNDTMKVYDKLEGKYFTFKKGQIEKGIKEYEKVYLHYFNKILNTENIINKFKVLPGVNNLTSENNNYKLSLNIIETLGKSFNLEETTIYKINKYNKIIIKKFKKQIRNNDNSTMIRIYKNLCKEDYKAVKKQAILSPIEFLKALYLYTIIEA